MCEPSYFWWTFVLYGKCVWGKTRSPDRFGIGVTGYCCVIILEKVSIYSQSASPFAMTVTVQRPKDFLYILVSVGLNDYVITFCICLPIGCRPSTTLWVLRPGWAAVRSKPLTAQVQASLAKPQSSRVEACRESPKDLIIYGFIYTE